MAHGFRVLGFVVLASVLGPQAIAQGTIRIGRDSGFVVYER